MRLMRRVLLGAFVTGALVIVAACVGDDPAPTAAPIDGGGPDGSVPGDSATTGDGGLDGEAQDSTTPGDAGQDAGFDVRALSGLRLWLESSNGLTGSPGFESW